MKGLFVVGTDTGVGKTTISAALVRVLRTEGARVGALKPVASGADPTREGLRSSDVESLRLALGAPVPAARICPRIYREPLAPSVAARRTGTPLDRDDLFDAVEAAVDWWSGRADLLVVEGAGGLLCPIAERTSLADLVVRLGFPILIVARRGLGTLNHSLLTIEAATRRGIEIQGLVFNGAEPPSNEAAETTNPDELSRMAPGTPILPDLKWGADPDAWVLAGGLGAWYDRFQSRRRID